jgi:hypothetical protein
LRPISIVSLAVEPGFNGPVADIDRDARYGDSGASVGRKGMKFLIAAPLIHFPIHLIDV